MTMSELYQNSGVFLTLQADADPATQFEDDLKNARLTNEDKDDVTFGEVRSGKVTAETLALTGIIATAQGRLWRYLWENAGKTVSFVYGPHGNETATDDKPHFLGDVKIPRRPEVGAEASVDSSRSEFEYEAPVIGEVLLDDGA